MNESNDEQDDEKSRDQQRKQQTNEKKSENKMYGDNKDQKDKLQKDENVDLNK